MKSKMSFCNGAVLKRTLFRGLPLWGAYLLCWLIVLPVVLLSNGEYMEHVYLKEYVLEIAAGSCAIVNFFYAPAVACMISSYLYKSRSANFFGALPLRRETMFLTQYLGGLCFSVLPNLIVAILTVLAGAYWGTSLVMESLIWVAAQLLSFVTYYGFAMLIAMIVGNLIALPLVYGVLNFTAVALEAIIRELLDIFVHGAWFSSEFFFDWASPLFYTLSSGQGPRVRSNWRGEVFESSTFYNWKLLLIYAAAGVVCALIAFYIHKKRRMESAGDVIAVRHLKPVFLYGFTAGCGLCIGYFLAAIVMGGLRRDTFVTTLLCMLIGAFIGYFVGQMLLHRSVRVFRKQYFLNFGVTAVVIVALMLCLRFDLFGYSRYIPAADEVEAVSIGYNENAVSTDPELIRKAISVHEIMMKGEEVEEYQSYRSAYLTYHLKNGKTVRRSYDLCVSDALSLDAGSPIRQYEELFNDPDYIVIRELRADYTAADIEFCTIHNDKGDEVYLTSAEAYEFLKTCVEPDLRETTLGWNEFSYRNIAREYAGVSFSLEFKDETQPEGYGYASSVREYCYMSITKDAKRVLAYAAEKGVEAVN